MINLKDKKISNIFLGDKKINKVYIGNKLVYSISRLPKEYQEVAYIESTGTQYVNTNVTDLIGNKYEVNIQVKQSYYDRTACFGADGGINVSIINCYWQIASEISSKNVNIEAFTKIVCERTASYRIMTIENETFRTNSGTNTSLKFWIGKPAGWHSTGYANAKYGNIKIWRNNTLVRDFVPCYRKSDEEIGLYDLVNDVFYTNAGTGTFLKGGDV